MRDTLRERCELFIENREVVKKAFPMENSCFYPICAMLLTEQNKSADLETLKDCRAILKKNTGVFSSFRGTAISSIITMLATDNDPESRLEKAVSLHKDLRKHFYSSEYLPVAAMMLSDIVASENNAEVSCRAGKIYGLMKSEHPFLTSSEDSVFAIMLALSSLSDDEVIREKHKEYPHLSLADCEYMWTGAHFCEELLNFDGFMLHASAVVYKDRAYLFSAPSGTGKSTHTKQWLDAFGEDAYILNDDKPVIRLLDGKAVVFGTPWSGKTDQNRNAGVLLGGICFLERADENWIKPVEAKDAAFGILNQTIRPGDKKRLEKLLELLDNVIKMTGVFRMGCTISTDAATMAYDAMRGERQA